MTANGEYLLEAEPEGPSLVGTGLIALNKQMYPNAFEVNWNGC
jgi:hypothetical protein